MFWFVIKWNNAKENLELSIQSSFLRNTKKLAMMAI